MHFDDVLVQVGEFGRHQIKVVLVLSYAGIAIGLTSLSMVFTLGISGYRCAIPDVQNDTFFAEEAMVNTTIPFGSQCTVFDIGPNGTENEVTCTRWVYDDTYYQPSAVMEFDSVCDKAVFRTLANTVYMIGMMIGGPVGGRLSDRFGRRTVAVGTVVLQAIFTAIQIFSPEMYSFMVLRLLTGAMHTACFGSMFTLAMEIFGPKWRKIFGMFGAIFYGVGGICLVPLAYFFPNWRHLTIATLVPCIPLFACWWLIPESPRWLIARGRWADADVALRKMAKENRKPPPDDEVLKSMETDDVKKVSIMRMLKNRVMLLRMIIMCCLWGSVSCTYFGLTLNSGNLSGNIYTNFALSMLMDIPATFYVVFFSLRIGRKGPHIFAMLSSSIACFSCVFVIMFSTHNWIVVALSTVGKFFITAAFTSSYFYTAELFPTPLRNVTNGICSMCARICTIGSPFLADLGMLIQGSFSKALPLVIFGSICFVVGLACFHLPETKGQNLPETIEEAAQLGKRKKSENLEVSKTLMAEQTV